MNEQEGRWRVVGPAGVLVGCFDFEWDAVAAAASANLTQQQHNELRERFPGGYCQWCAAGNIPTGRAQFPHLPVGGALYSYCELHRVFWLSGRRDCADRCWATMSMVLWISNRELLLDNFNVQADKFPGLD